MNEKSTYDFTVPAYQTISLSNNNDLITVDLYLTSKPTKTEVFELLKKDHEDLKKVLDISKIKKEISLPVELLKEYTRN